jgi:hypothetical protein
MAAAPAGAERCAFVSPIDLTSIMELPERASTQYFYFVLVILVLTEGCGAAPSVEYVVRCALRGTATKLI